jgi:putative ABC transport system substrate-binding protein
MISRQSSSPGAPWPEYVEGIRRGLAEVGFSEGGDVMHEYLNADGHPERLPALAGDLVRRRPAAIFAGASIIALAAKAATRDIPIIFITGTDPVELGLVASLNRPGGNLTGVTVPLFEIAEKRLQLLHQAVPAAETIALLVGPADSPFDQLETGHVQSAARTLGLRLLVFNVTFYDFRQALTAKRLQLLHEIAPSVRLIGLLTNPAGPLSEPEKMEAETAARTLGVAIDDPGCEHAC